MLSVSRVHLASDIPIVGLEIVPYLLLRLPDGSTTDDVPETLPIDGHFLRYRWYRVLRVNKIAVCSIHPKENATVQCTGCIKTNAPLAMSYHCSTKCFVDSWYHHLSLHDNAAKSIKENGVLHLHLNSYGPLQPASIIEKEGGETWLEVGRCRSYTPNADDLDHVLRFECVVVDEEKKTNLGDAVSVTTSCVTQAPSPAPRCMVPLRRGVASVTSYENFSVLTYNILSDVRASSEIFDYCPKWALSWAYRRENLLREIVGYHADILCLQEVQCNHFDDFLAPKLEKHGYQGLLKKRTSQVVHGPDTVDGCAVFFRRNIFSLVRKYEVEFNKLAQALSDALTHTDHTKILLNRLFKDNIALLVVLEPKFSPEVSGQKQLLCVANVQMHLHEDLKDVKLWQVHNLIKLLERICMSTPHDIPLVICGDFKSLPRSAPHMLLSTGMVNAGHPDLADDPLGILRPSSKLAHQLPLVSAYAALRHATCYEQTRHLDPATHEPLLTTCTNGVVGTHDYIFYTADLLSVEAVLELVGEVALSKDTALPSPSRSSDHVALLAQLSFRAHRRW
ncbi:carbon catabolite repressor protein 4 homolog 1-like [Wolffia australiana]